MLYHVIDFASVLQLFTLQFLFCLLETLERFSNVNVHTNHLGILLKCRFLSQEV